MRGSAVRGLIFAVYKPILSLKVLPSVCKIFEIFGTSLAEIGLQIVEFHIVTYSVENSKLSPYP